MERKVEKKVIDDNKMNRFLDKLRELPESSLKEKPNDQGSLREKFLQKILDDIGPQ